MKNLQDDSRRENENTHFMFSNFFYKIPPFEIIWKNMVQPDKPQSNIRRMRIACWIPKTTNTHSEYVILI